MINYNFYPFEYLKLYRIKSVHYPRKNFSEKTAVICNTGHRGFHRFSRVAKVRPLMRFCTPLETVSSKTAVFNGVQNLINCLTFATPLNRLQPRFSMTGFEAVYKTS